MSPTEASSLKLNADGKITKFSTGYVVDRSGNTGGLGALFGIMRKLLQLAGARGSPSSRVFSMHVSLFLCIMCDGMIFCDCMVLPLDGNTIQS